MNRKIKASALVLGIGFLFIFLIGIVLWISHESGKSSQTTFNKNPLGILSGHQSQTENQTEEVLRKQNQPSEKINFADRFQFELTQIEKGLSSSPEDDENRLRALAEVVDKSTAQLLYDELSNHNSSGDKRLLSLEILVRCSAEYCEQYLTDFSKSAPYEHGNSSQDSEELAFRGRAVEGIKTESKINLILQKSPSQFVVDRANRQLLFLRGKVASPESQDKDALRKLTQ